MSNLSITPPSLFVGQNVISGTSGSIPYIDSNSSLAQDNSNIFYDPTNKRLGLRTNSPTDTLDLMGSFALKRRTITTNLTVDTTTPDQLILCNQSGNITITLPVPTDGRYLLIKDISGTANTNTITLARNGSEKIEGLAASKVLQTDWGSWGVVSDGTDWYLID